MVGHSVAKGLELHALCEWQTFVAPLSHIEVPAMRCKTCRQCAGSVALALIAKDGLNKVLVKAVVVGEVARARVVDFCCKLSVRQHQLTSVDVATLRLQPTNFELGTWVLRLVPEIVRLHVPPIEAQSDPRITQYKDVGIQPHRYTGNLESVSQYSPLCPDQVGIVTSAEI
eukprot:CAMPEP_0115843322 /NCGR_PEP_ID=MMETSP0287-20121206/8252_1 /TAXON_ID=412157 /ORGANISM="Chrysochromulina rotalis, Strain UIO044" /LENGTH=170 /DNA_ID=CAMNT_0003297011 /DNA_START=129 /DNA_END=641 /DNA_ORIENTATION=+